MGVTTCSPEVSKYPFFISSFQLSQGGAFEVKATAGDTLNGEREREMGREGHFSEIIEGKSFTNS